MSYIFCLWCRCSGMTCGLHVKKTKSRHIPLHVQPKDTVSHAVMTHEFVSLSLSFNWLPKMVSKWNLNWHFAALNQQLKWTRTWQITAGGRRGLFCKKRKCDVSREKRSQLEEDMYCPLCHRAQNGINLMSLYIVIKASPLNDRPCSAALTEN